MGSHSEGKTSKSDKSCSPAPSTNNVHVYPDWATMQAYYGPRVPLPPHYNSAVASGHPPHPYMWPQPQPMMPPYGSPYATIYSHGGVYAHPGVPPVATPLAIETPMKSMRNIDQGLQKKLKGNSGTALSISNGNAKKGEGVTEDGQSKSCRIDGSSEGSDGNTAGMDLETNERSHDDTPVTGRHDKDTENAVRVPSVEFNAATSKTVGTPVSSVEYPGKLIGPVLSPGTAMPSHLRNANTDWPCPPSVPQNGTVMNPGTLLQNERELKRERRKLSNRESARRSRLRKQAETEELARIVENLTAENTALKSEINQLTEKSKKIRQENAKLMEKVKNIQIGQTEEISLNKVDDKGTQPLSTENLLSKVDRSDSVKRKEDDERYNKESKPGAMLHQVLDRKPRTDAIAAG